MAYDRKEKRWTRAAPMPRGGKGLKSSLFQRKASHKRPQRRKRLVSDWRIKHEPGTRRRLVEDLDEVTSQIVRHRDGFRCVLCGSTFEPQAGHLWKRGIYATRWHLDNVWTQCSKHNRDHNTVPEPFMNFVAAKIGEERYDALRALKESTRKISDAELESLLASYRQMLREMREAA